jgi:hypothetical protein
VGNVSFLESDHERAEFRQVQPVRHLTLEYSSVTLASTPFSGDNKDKPGVACGRGLQETQKYRMRFVLG